MSRTALTTSGRLQTSLDQLLRELRADQQARWQEELSKVLDDFEADLAEVRSGGTPRAPGRADDSPAVLLRRALEQLTGLAGKDLVAIDVVTPYLAEGTDGVALTNMLAGEFLFAFGGFFDEGLRWSDFALGFVCMLNWMSRGLGGYGLSKDQVDAALDAALRAFYDLPQWSRRRKTKGFMGYGLNAEMRDLAKTLKLPAGESWTPSEFGETTVRMHMLSSGTCGSRCGEGTTPDRGLREGPARAGGARSAHWRGGGPERAFSVPLPPHEDLASFHEEPDRRREALTGLSRRA
jgi:hypothetical protein